MLSLLAFLLASSFTAVAQDDTTDSLDLVMDTTFLESYEYPLGSVEEAHVINFQTKSVAYLKLGQAQHFLDNNQLKLQQASSQVASLNTFTLTNDGYYRLELPPGQQYELLTRTTQGNWKAIKILDTRPGTGTEIITVSEQLNEALHDWQDAGNQDLYTFLMNRPELPVYERFAFMQDFLKKGAPLSDLYAQGNIPQIAFILGPIGPGPGGPGGPDGPDSGCDCRVLNIAVGSEVSPSNSESNSPEIIPTTLYDNSGGLTYWFFKAERDAGPAKSYNLLGKTEFCTNTSKKRVLDKSGSPSIARIRIRQMCKEGNWTPGDCFCRQNLTFRYRYNSRSHTEPTVPGVLPPCGNSDGKQAHALIEDLAIATVTSVRHMDGIGTSVMLHSDASLSRVYSSCNWDLQEERYLDAVKLGFSIYGYSVGIGAPDNLAGGIVDILYKEYQKSSLYDALKSFLTNPWVTGSCEEEEISNSLDNTISVSVDDNRVLYFTLGAGSFMEVGGETMWTSSASINSGFSVSVLLQKKEVVDDPELCCTKPVGIYATKSYHPVYGPNDFLSSVGLHLAEELGCCFPVSPFDGALILNDNDRGILIGDEIPLCATTINHNLIREGTALNASSTKLSFDSNERTVIIEDGTSGREYIVELVSVDGRYIGRTKQICDGSMIVPIDDFKAQLPSGIYFINVFNGEGQSSHKIFLP